MDQQLSPGWLGQRAPVAWILGLGLIGGSWAGALSARGWKVIGYDLDKISLETALSWGWIKSGCSRLPSHIDADLIILALPLKILLPIMADLKERVGKGTIITDVCSLKVQVAEKALRFTEQGAFFIGGHPMTGSEKSGFQAANPDLFKGYPYVLTPDDHTPPQVVDRLAKLIKEMGAKLVYRKPLEHDREVGMISHLPHVLAVVLAQSTRDLERTEGLAPIVLAGRSFRDMTRIADSSPKMWQDIFLNNRESLLESIDIWEKQMNYFKRYLQEMDEEGIEAAFKEAQEARKQLD